MTGCRSADDVMMTSIRPRPPGSHQRCSLSSVVSRRGLRREMRTCVILRVAFCLALLHCADSWLFRRRRRRRCSSTKCRWGSWRKNTSCNTRCGATGRELWIRSVTVRASCGGTCTGSGREYRPCNRICYNGGKLMTVSCKCTGRYRGTCCDVCE